MNRRKDDGKAEAFDKRQRMFADKVRPLLNPDLELSRSDSDLAWLKNQTAIEESVSLSGGNGEDADYILNTLYGAARHYRRLYGESPSEGQLAAMGGALESFGNWRELTMNGGLGRKIIAESTDGDTVADNFSIMPHFMTVAALLPLTSICYNFCHSIGNRRADKVTVFELEEQAGENPYGIPEGTRLNGFYDGGLSNTRRRVNANYKLDDDDIKVDFDRTLSPNSATVTYDYAFEYPITKGRVFLIVNKRTVAVDNGSGGFSIVGDGEYDDGLKVFIESVNTFEYWSSDEAVIDITLKFEVEDLPGDASDAEKEEAENQIKENMKSIVWFRVETDVENYPEFISETQYATRSFDICSEPYVISAGMTLRAVLKSIRNMRLNIPDIAFSRLLAIVAADMDRKTLNDLYDYAEGKTEFDLKLNDYRDPYEQWSRIREPMNAISEKMQRRTGGMASVRAFVGGSKFKLLFMNMGDERMKIADTARNPALAGQPHYIGRFEGYHLFFNPSFPLSENGDEIAIGVGKGTQISQCGAVLGISAPPLLHQSVPRNDLSLRCSVYGESFSDQPPEAYKYVSRLTLTDSSG